MLMLFSKYFFICLCTFYSYYKLLDINCSKKSRNLLFISVLIITCSTLFIGEPYTLARVSILFVLSYLFLSIQLKHNPVYSFISLTLSYSLSFIFYTLSSIIISIISVVIYHSSEKVPYQLANIIMGLLQFLFTHFFLEVKRFRNGISSMIRSNKSFSYIFISLSHIIYICYISSNVKTYGITLRYILLIICPFISLTYVFYWRHRITQTYREKLRLANEKSLEDEISNQKETISNLEADNARLSQIVHKDNKIILAMLTAVNEHLENASVLTPEELAVRGKELNAQLQDMAKDRQGILSTQTRQVNALPKSGLHTIDGMLSFMETRAKENGITYKLQIEENSKEIASNAIQEADLLHLLGDLIDNAIIATKHTNDKKEILIHLGNLQNHFLLEISDSGIPFSLDTYQSFGNEPHTTHGDDGGSGIGLMDIWKLKRKYKASLHIYEYKEGESIYTKKLTFIFDHKNHFLLQTPRHKEAMHTLTRGDLYIFPNKNNTSMN